MLLKLLLYGFSSDVIFAPGICVFKGFPKVSLGVLVRPPVGSLIVSLFFVKLGPHNAWYVFVVRHVWMCQKDSSNLTHTVCFDVSIYRPNGEPDVTNEWMTHLLKVDTFFHTHDARIMTHDASQIRTTHRVDLALGILLHWFVLASCPWIHRTLSSCLPWHSLPPSCSHSVPHYMIPKRAGTLV